MVSRDSIVSNSRKHNSCRSARVTTDVMSIGFQTAVYNWQATFSVTVKFHFSSTIPVIFFLIQTLNIFLP
jgi:hypothetical protein